MNGCHTKEGQEINDSGILSSLVGFPTSRRSRHNFKIWIFQELAWLQELVCWVRIKETYVLTKSQEHSWGLDPGFDYRVDFIFVVMIVSTKSFIICSAEACRVQVWVKKLWIVWLGLVKNLVMIWLLGWTPSNEFDFFHWILIWSFGPMQSVVLLQVCCVILCPSWLNNLTARWGGWECLLQWFIDHVWNFEIHSCWVWRSVWNAVLVQHFFVSLSSTPMSQCLEPSQLS